MSRFIEKKTIPVVVVFIFVLVGVALSFVLNNLLLFFISAACTFLLDLTCTVFKDVKVEMKTLFAKSHPVLFWLAKTEMMQLGFVLIYLFNNGYESLLFGDSSDVKLKLWEIIWIIITFMLFIPSKIIIDKVENQKDKKAFKSNN